MSQVSLPPGAIINGYRVERVLGSGGFGVTYLARDLLDLPFAIKEYFPDAFAVRAAANVVPASAEAAAMFNECKDRFAREGRALALLAGKSEGIVPVRTYFEANGTCYLVMDFIAGTTLRDVLREVGSGLPAERVERLMAELLASVRVVHDAGMMHRDIKPANIIMRDDGHAILIDFGSIRETSSGQTTIHTQIFTPGFAPLEQILGLRQGPQSDLYAIGAVAYHAIGGHLTDALSRHQALAAGRPDPQPPARDIGRGRYPETLLRLIDEALATDPAARPPSAEAMLAVLARDRKPAPPPPDAPRSPVRRAGRMRAGWWAAGAGLVVLAGGAWFVADRHGGLFHEIERAIGGRHSSDPRVKQDKVATGGSSRTETQDAEAARRAAARQEAARQAAARQAADQEAAKQEAERQAAARQAADQEAAKQEAARQAAARQAADQEAAKQEAARQAAARQAADQEAARQEAARQAAARQAADQEAAKQEAARQAAARQAADQEAARQEAARRAAARQAADQEASRQEAARREAEAQEQERRLQTALASLGYYHPGSDGSAARFQVAVRQWQAFSGADETGTVSADQNGQILRDADHLATLLKLPGKSPRGAAPDVVKGAADRFRRGAAFEAGEGQPKDTSEAAWWYAQAAGDGWAAGYTNLGTLYARGAGVPGPDIATARLLWLTAAALGDGTAMFNLGVLAEKGIGGPPDLARARRWYGLGAEHKHKGSIEALRRLGP